MPRWRGRAVILIIGGLLSACLVLSIPVWLLQRNPPVVQEPAWDSPQTRALAVPACFDCHSDQTSWPWFTRVPPGSFIAVFDTVRGRRHLNFSEWGTVPVGGERGRGVGDVVEVIQDGSMPPALYTMMHPDAVLSPAEEQQLIQGLQASLK